MLLPAVAVPLALTLFRLVSVGLLVAAGLGSSRLPGWVIVLYWIGGLTDAIDGTIARRFGGCTPTGATLDLVSDKLWALAGLAFLVRWGTVAPWAPAAIILREVIVSVRRFRLGSARRSLPSTTRSRLKMLLQGMALGLLVAYPALPGRSAILWLVAAVTWGTGFELLRSRSSPLRGDAS